MSKITLDSTSSGSGTINLKYSLNSTNVLSLVEENSEILTNTSGMTKSGDTVSGDYTVTGSLDVNNSLFTNNMTMQDYTALTTDIADLKEIYQGAYNFSVGESLIIVQNNSGYARQWFEIIFSERRGFNGWGYIFANVSRYGTDTVKSVTSGLTIDRASSIDGNINRNGIRFTNNLSRNVGSAITIKVYRGSGSTSSPFTLQSRGF